MTLVFSYLKKFSQPRTLLQVSITMVTLVMTGQTLATASGTMPSVQTLRSHSRIRVPIDQGVDYKLEKTPGGFSLTLMGLTFSEMGAALGEESQWAEALSKKFNDERLQDVKWVGLKYSVRLTASWVFPKGPNAPAVPKMEVFDYRDKKTNELVLDFWVAQSATVAQVALQNKLKRQKETQERTLVDAKLRQNRKLASLKARAAFEDALLICSKPSADSLIILPYKPLTFLMKITDHFDENYPDADYAYWTPSGTTEEDEYLKLALKLYKEEKFALVLRTVDFFQKDQKLATKQNAQQIGRELEFLRANALIRLKLKDEGLQALHEIAKGTPKSSQALYAVLFLALKAFNTGNWSVAQERYLWLIQFYPEHRQAWVFHRALAETLYQTQQYDGAAKEFQWVEKHAPTAESRAEGGLRQADIALIKRQYESALASYFRALNAHPKIEKMHPSFLINRSEVLYQLGERTRATEGFEQFLKNFEGHPEGWRAELRLAELELAGDETQQHGRDRLGHIVNRYPATPGAVLARAALLPCGNHMGLDWFGANRFYENELAAFQSDQFFLENLKILRILARVRGVIGMLTVHQNMEFATQVLEGALKEMGAGYPASRTWVGQLFTTLFRKRILTFLAEGTAASRIKALRFYADHKDYAFGIEDPDYLLKLALAANELELGVYGAELTDRYFHSRERYLKRKRELASATGAEDLDDHELEEKLKRAERSFVQASGLWITKGTAEQKQVKALLADVIEESEYSFEKEVILGLLAQHEKKESTALGHALKADLLWTPRSGISADRLRFWLAGLQAKAGDPLVAIAIYQKLIKGGEGTTAPESLVKGDQFGLPRAPQKNALLFLTAQLLEEKKQWGEAAQLYETALKEQGAEDRASYELGRVLLKTGNSDDRTKGIQFWKTLAQSKKDEFWNRLAREALATEVQP